MKKRPKTKKTATVSSTKGKASSQWNAAQKKKQTKSKSGTKKKSTTSPSRKKPALPANHRKGKSIARGSKKSKVRASQHKQTAVDAAAAANRNGSIKKEVGDGSHSLLSQAPNPSSERSNRVVRTFLTAKELKEFKAILLQKRAELAGDVEHLTSEALSRNESGAGEQSTMPIHMADLGSDTWEQDFTLGLIANEQAVVREIDQALTRIEDRTYGICMATDAPISRERLRAKPWAKYCIEYARLREEGRAP